MSDRRRAHIGRVIGVLRDWSQALGADEATSLGWRDAGLLHDALRDAPEEVLRALAPEWASWPAELLHGPAAAARLEHDGEVRREVLEAIRWHTVGNPRWGRTGRALYMADFLEPGRAFGRAERAFLSAQVPRDFDGVLRQVVRMRLEWSLREGQRVHGATVELWNVVR